MVATGFSGVFARPVNKLSILSAAARFASLDVLVHVLCEPDFGVSWNLSDHLQGHALRNQERYAGMALIMEALFGKASGLHQCVELLQYFSIIDGGSNCTGEDVAGFLPSQSSECAFPLLAVQVGSNASNARRRQIECSPRFFRFWRQHYEGPFLFVGDTRRCT